MSAIIYTAPQVLTNPGGTPPEIQYNSGGTFAGASNVEISAEGTLMPVDFNTPLTIPPANRSDIYVSGATGEQVLKLNPNIGFDAPVQMGLGYRQISAVQLSTGAAPTGFGAWVGVLGVTATAAWTTTVAPTLLNDAANALPNYMYGRILSTNLVNSTADIWVNAPNRAMIVGGTVFCHGGKLVLTFGFPNYAITERIFCGYTTSTTGLNGAIDPSTFLNCIGVGKDSGESNLSFLYNDNVGLCSKIDTGFSVSSTSVFRLTIYIPPVGTTMYMTLEKISTTSIQSVNSSRSVNLPAIGTFLYPHVMASTATSVTPVSVAIINFYEEQK
jgi:hypothetical protein